MALSLSVNMASTRYSTSTDIYPSIPQANPKRPTSFTRPLTKKLPPLAKGGRRILVTTTRKIQSLSERQVLSGSSSSFSHRIDRSGELLLFAEKLNQWEPTEVGFLSVFEEIPHELNAKEALLVLQSLKHWQKACLFLNWVRTQELFPLKSVFYNVTMKSLRSWGQFELVEELAEEMRDSGVELNNVTYSTIISCATQCRLFEKGIEWFERMYDTGLTPNWITFSAALHVYAKYLRVEEAMRMYQRGVAGGMRPNSVVFASLARMFRNVGDVDGIAYVLREMERFGIRPNKFLCETLIDAMGKAGQPGPAKRVCMEMVQAGYAPGVMTLTTLVRLYSNAGWGNDAMELLGRIRSNNWPMDRLLYNAFLSLCADLRMEDEAEQLFQEMKGSKHCRPDRRSYASMLDIYASGGNDDKAMGLFQEMSKLGIAISMMGCTNLIQCLGNAQRVDDLVRVFDVSVGRGMKPGDKFCGCLLYAISLLELPEDMEKVLSCLQKANPRLAAFVILIEDERTSFETVEEEFRLMASNREDPTILMSFCNHLIDICWNKNLRGRAQELLYIGTIHGVYPNLYHKTRTEWRLDVRKLSVGAALTALEDWIGTLAKYLQENEALPELFSARTGTGTRNLSNGLSDAFASHMEKHAAPFRHSELKAGCFVATRDDLVTWIQSLRPSHMSA